MVIRRHLRKFGITLTGVTYPKDVDILMVVTRAEPYVGWRKGDDPTQLKQFGKGKLEAMVLKALEREGVKQTEYVTAHGWL
ncbi:hypothetical protein LshimejAT787_0601080 [Lyophyllum shimeji]|uniref:Uncharacterized protein n=1 Tax=Lyophyllum shimeji TaxID=47721 RepID=A0A9P3PNM6_LYOSH|nr:hypothetical protein LshimejAT787_0601080 [Lyophyllum shimeji]